VACRIPYLIVGSTLRAAAAATILVAALVTVLAGGAFAQTLTDPNPPAKWSPPHAGAKPSAAASAKPCSGFGAGFVQVPGTGTCIKIGGWVSVEGSASR
jgi:Porin subfamily